MMAYADAQLAPPEAQQYSGAASPPLLLTLVLLLAHGLSITLGRAMRSWRITGARDLVNGATPLPVKRICAFLLATALCLTARISGIA